MAPRALEPRRRDEAPEPIADAPGVGEASECDREPSSLDDVAPRRVEDVDPLVPREEPAGDARPLVISRQQEHGDARVRDGAQRPQRSLDEIGGDAAPVEKVAPVDDEVHLTAERCFESQLVVSKEVRTTAAPAHPRPPRLVEAEMGIGEKEDAKRWHQGLSDAPVSHELPAPRLGSH